MGGTCGAGMEPALVTGAAWFQVNSFQMRDVLQSALPLRATCSTTHQVDIALPALPVDDWFRDIGTAQQGGNAGYVDGLWPVGGQKAQRIQKNHSLLPLDKRSVETGNFSCREFGEELKVWSWPQKNPIRQLCCWLQSNVIRLQGTCVSMQEGMGEAMKPGVREIGLIRKGAGMQPRVAAEKISTKV